MLQAIRTLPPAQDYQAAKREDHQGEEDQKRGSKLVFQEGHQEAEAEASLDHPLQAHLQSRWSGEASTGRCGPLVSRYIQPHSLRTSAGRWPGSHTWFACAPSV